MYEDRNSSDQMRDTMRLLRACVVFVAAALCAAEEAPATPFDKEGLEALLRKEHSQRVSNIYDSEHSIQYTWDIDNQVLCPGVDGKCEKEEL